MMKWAAFDVLKVIIANLGVESMKAWVPDVHNAFYELTKIEKYKPFLEGFSFEPRIGFYFSQKLRIYFENMEESGLLAFESLLELDRYNITSKMFNDYEKTKEYFSEEELCVLSEMGKYLGEGEWKAK